MLRVVQWFASVRTKRIVIYGCDVFIGLFFAVGLHDRLAPLGLSSATLALLLVAFIVMEGIAFVLITEAMLRRFARWQADAREQYFHRAFNKK